MQNAEREAHMLHAHLHSCLSVKLIYKDFISLMKSYSKRQKDKKTQQYKKIKKPERQTWKSKRTKPLTKQQEEKQKSS